VHHARKGTLCDRGDGEARQREEPARWIPARAAARPREQARRVHGKGAIGRAAHIRLRLGKGKSRTRQLEVL